MKNTAEFNKFFSKLYRECRDEYIKDNDFSANAHIKIYLRFVKKVYNFFKLPMINEQQIEHEIVRKYVQDKKSIRQQCHDFLVDFMD
jgi:hypothetical protein